MFWQVGNFGFFAHTLNVVVFYSESQHFTVTFPREHCFYQMQDQEWPSSIALHALSDEKVHTNKLQIKFATLDRAMLTPGPQKIINHQFVLLILFVLSEKKKPREIIIMEYNNNLATQHTPQPRVSYQPGDHQQQPTAPPDPPVTQSMSAWFSPLVTGDNHVIFFTDQ